MAKRREPQWLRQLSAEQRLSKAENKVEAMLDTAIDLVHLHASNRIICYSDQISRQIPRSDAGVTFRIISKALLQRELSGVCTFWDDCGQHRNSIPTVMALMDSDDVRELVRERKLRIGTSGRQLSAEDDYPELLQWITNLSDKQLVNAADKRTHLLEEAIQEATAFVDSDVLRAARDSRSSYYLAHNLSSESRQFPDLRSRYGDERRMLEATQPILEKLNLACRNSSYDWEGTWRIATRNAEAL